MCEDTTRPDTPIEEPATAGDRWSPALCFYCGERDATTRDHVIPRSWFLDRAGLNLPTVPSCRECNRSYQQDEEYARALLVSQRNAGPEALELFDAPITRGFRRPQGQGLLHRIYESFENVEITTPTGLYVGRVPAIRVETDRFERVVRKIVHGLYFQHFETRLDPQTHVDITDLSECSPDVGRGLARVLPIAGAYGHVVRYRCGRVEERPTASAWLIGFFDGVILSCITDCEEGIRRIERERRIVLPRDLTVLGDD